MANLFFYGAILLAAVGAIGVFRFIRNPQTREPTERGKVSSVAEAKEQWFIRALNDGVFNLSGLTSIDEEIELGGIKFKGKIKINPSPGGGRTQASESDGPIVYLRGAKRFGFKSEQEEMEES